MLSVAVIGGGPSGIVAAKTAVESGLVPVVFEKHSGIGGVWRSEAGSVWDSMRTNISRYTCMFSDFPWKDSVQDFPSQPEMIEYLTKFVAAFQLGQHIRLNADVQKIVPFGDRWQVEWISGGTKQVQDFDFVIVATGIFAKAMTPPLSGLDNFKGRVLHAQAYKNPESFKGKKVAVVGNAFSGCEIAAELSAVAQQGHLTKNF